MTTTVSSNNFVDSRNLNSGNPRRSRSVTSTESWDDDWIDVAEQNGSSSMRNSFSSSKSPSSTFRVPLTSNSNSKGSNFSLFYRKIAGPPSAPQNVRKNQQRTSSCTCDQESSSRRKCSLHGASSSAPPASTEFSEEQGVNADKMKSRLMSMWNNVKYGWTMKTKTTFSIDHPIVFLGQMYDPRLDHLENSQQHYHGRDGAVQVVVGQAALEGFEAFRQDFVSRIWLTYRREFPSIENSTLTTDCGWGCMLRSGQMLLAQAFIVHFLDRGWRWFREQTPSEEEMHRQIIRWFGDLKSEECPFSVHRLVALGEKVGKKAGDWYGPASVAHILRQSLEMAVTSFPVLKTINIYVAQDCTIFKQDVIDLCTSSNEPTSPSKENGAASTSDHNTTSWKSVVILIPARLGGETLNPIYIQCIRDMLTHESCIGIIGGRPRHSLYFTGWQDEKLINMDPHLCQEAVDVTKPIFALQSFHSMSPRKMSFHKMDPSCAIGFICKTRRDFEEFASATKQMAVPRKMTDYPIFVVAEGRQKDQSLIVENVSDRVLRVRLSSHRRGSRSKEQEGEEFVYI